jgi:hypothetical protein
MPGLNWTDRRKGDWLASNGRWYPPKDYPRGWNMSSLPPAPGHDSERGVGKLLSSAARNFQNAADSASKAVGSEPTSTVPPRPTKTRAPAPARPEPSQVARPIRRTPGLADAVVVNQSTHRSRLASGAAPNKGLPPAPGRVSEDAPDMAKIPSPGSSPPPPKSSAPSSRSSPPPPTRAPSASRPTSSSGPKRPPMPSVGNAKSGADSVSGELGKALGSVRSEFDRAIEGME